MKDTSKAKGPETSLEGRWQPGASREAPGTTGGRMKAEAVSRSPGGQP